jgi:hypothetical protein
MEASMDTCQGSPEGSFLQGAEDFFPSDGTEAEVRRRGKTLAKAR